MDIEDTKRMRKYREEKFMVEVGKSHREMYEDEIALSVTHNGSQWTSITLLPKELIEVVRKLQTGSRIVCPFCSEGDFDKVGLKHHIGVAGCSDYEETIDI